MRRYDDDEKDAMVVRYGDDDDKRLLFTHGLCQRDDLPMIRILKSASWSDIFFDW